MSGQWNRRLEDSVCGIHFWPVGFLLARLWEVEAEGEGVIRKPESPSSAQPILQQKLWQPHFNSFSSLKNSSLQFLEGRDLAKAWR